ncbi:hypothetical protein CHU98_g2526 [Xylaria longipes]|nr:hypothetical protein CHU98_g2526 [Xylaria longipes]
MPISSMTILHISGDVASSTNDHSAVGSGDNDSQCIKHRCMDYLKKNKKSAVRYLSSLKRRAKLGSKSRTKEQEQLHSPSRNTVDPVELYFYMNAEDENAPVGWTTAATPNIPQSVPEGGLGSDFFGLVGGVLNCSTDDGDCGTLDGQSITTIVTTGSTLPIISVVLPDPALPSPIEPSSRNMTSRHPPPASTHQADTASEPPRISLISWLAVGGTGPPPAPTSFSRMASERKAAYRREQAYKEARKAASADVEKKWHATGLVGGGAAKPPGRRELMRLYGSTGTVRRRTGKGETGRDGGDAGRIDDNDDDGDGNNGGNDNNRNDGDNPDAREGGGGVMGKNGDNGK